MDTARRALISVSDKTGVVDFARGLDRLGWELIASPGTARVLAEAGLGVIDVADHTGMPVMLGHRVVTLHPRLHGGILADRADPTHRDDLEAHGIDLIDLVVVNLYPFVDSPGVEMIDIGGPSLIRAAAKNHAHVGVVVDPAGYGPVLAELETDGGLSDATRRRLARSAFARTAAYDAAIADWFDRLDPTPPPEPGSGDDALPTTVHLALERAEELRYGENPHQRGARYRHLGRPGFWDGVVCHSGVALSYLNLCDADAAWRLAHDLGDDPAVVIVKHANPCGVAVAADLATAYTRAYRCDTRSAFGGVVATNAVIDGAMVQAMAAAAQADVVIAPGYEPGVIERLADRRRSTRVLQAPAGAAGSGPDPPQSQTRPQSRPRPGFDLHWRTIGGDLLAQDGAHFATDPEHWSVVTARRPSPSERADAVFAWRVCAHTSSNAVVLARAGVAWGIGAGQQNRVEAGALAAARAGGRAAGGACASDGFYPFGDGIRAAADAEVAVVVQPGGSVNDETVISAADELGLAMMFTGERQFRH